MKLPTRILLLTATLAAISAARAQPAAAAPVASSATPAPGAPAGGSSAAAPAPAAPVQLQPLLVTGDLWESPLSRIPASVSVYDTDALRTGAVKHFGDLVDQIPNLTWTGGTSRPRYLQIRGIGENSQYEGETPDSTVRFLVDDFDFTGLGTLGGTFDVRQVEVLRGPQAGAFGANAAGGLVRLVTNAPTSYWTGNIEGTVGGDDLRSGGFAVGGPLISATPEKLMMRLAVQQSESDGFRRNLTLNRDTNARDEFTARLRLTFNPTADWRWDGAALYANIDNGFDDFALDNNGRFTYSDQPGRDEQESTALRLRGTYSGLSGARFTTITSGSKTDSVYSYDDDWTAASYMGFSDLRRDRMVFSQELRFDSALTRDALGWIDRWTLGAYFSDIDEDSTYTNEDPFTLRGLVTDYQGRNSALFGQVAHDFTPQTRLVLGLRAEQIDIEGSGRTSRFDKTAGTFEPAVSFAPQFDDTLLGGKIALEHELSSGRLLFASLTRGYKGGGVNVDARISPPDDPLTYDTEYLWNYELGLRGAWLDQRLVGEFTAFYLDRRHTQVRDSAGFGGSYRFFTANARGANVSGIEASGSFAVTREWSFLGSLALMDSELDAFTLTNGNTGGGRRVANTPRYGYTLGSRYRADSGLFGQVELVSRAEQLDSNNQDEARRSFNVVNASLGYTWRQWTLTVWGRNLFDEAYDKRVFFFGNEDPDYIPARYESRADPRQIGATVGYRF